MQRMDKGERNIVVFSAPGLKPDVRLLIFDKLEYHVHSTILKLHSRFFRTFLDSPEKTTANPSSTFRYTWTTQVDLDQTWSLISQPQNASLISTLKNPAKQDREEETFARLLSGIHGKVITLRNLKELYHLVAVSDYYFALQVLSNAMDGILFQSHLDLQNGDLEKILETAQKLRSPTLFREGLIFSVGPWTSPEYRMFKNEGLKEIAERAHHGVCAKLADAHMQILQISFKDAMDVILNVNVILKEDYGEGVCIPKYYHRLSEALVNGVKWFDDETKALLKGSLALYPGLRAGVGVLYDHFLCIEIDDKDLPWDQNQTDW